MEDDLEESNPQVQTGIEAARKAYEAGEYMILEEYTA